MAQIDDDMALNSSLDDVIVLLEREIERLKESLELFRQSTRDDRQDIIRWHVRSLDERQDALENMKALLSAPRPPQSRH
jgi:hypothetical protein